MFPPEAGKQNTKLSGVAVNIPLTMCTRESKNFQGSSVQRASLFINRLVGKRKRNRTKPELRRGFWWSTKADPPWALIAAKSRDFGRS